MTMSIGEKIMRARKMRCLSRAVMADRLAISLSSYAAYELGKSNPNIERLCDIAKILHVSPNYLLDWPDTRNDEDQKILDLAKKMAEKASDIIGMTMVITTMLSKKSKQSEEE